MMERVVEFILRSALICAGTAAVLGGLRVQAARTRHMAWTCVVMTMLLLPFWNAWGPKAELRILPQASAAASGVRRSGPAAALSTIAIPAGTDFRAGEASYRIVLTIYLAGVALLLLRLAIGTVRARRIRGAAVWGDGQWTSARCAAPVTVGWVSPRVLLPEGWRDWSAQQLQAALTHEQEHAGCRDPLVQWLALLNRAVFWFHPLAWWVERKLAALAEEACDAAVLARGHDPQEYSGYLLEMAQAVMRSGMRVEGWGMGMPGSFLGRRIVQILGQRRPTPVTRARLVCAAFSCALLSTLFAATTVARRTAMPAVLAQVRTPQSGVEAQLRVLLFDMTRLNTAEQGGAVSAAMTFVQGRQDSFAVIVYRGGRVEVLQDFTTERDRVIAVLQQMNSSKTSDSGSGPGGLQQVMTILEPVKGKKAVVYFIGQAGAPAATKELLDAAVRASIAFFPIDVRGK